MRSLVLVCAFAIACSPAAPPQDEIGAGGQSLDLGKVWVLDSAPTSQILGCSGMCVYRRGFWVDLSVSNEAYDKKVGIAWTLNGWASNTVTYATYERTLDDGREQWGLDVDFGTSYGYPAPEVEYAAFVVQNGVTTWDPRNNHFIRDSVTAGRPVRLISSGVSYEHADGAVLSGNIRVFPFELDKRVTVLYSVDAWATWTEVPATWSHSNDWKFRIALGASPLPDEVQFAVRYRSGGVEAWDSRGGENHRHTIRPKLVPLTSPPDVASGIITVSAYFKTDLPLQAQRARVDNGPWNAGGWYTFSTLPLADGAHELQFHFESVGGYQETATVPFSVKNRVQPLGGWAIPNVTGDSDYPWDLATDTDGKVYVLWSSGAVVRSDAFGSTSTPFVYPSIQSASQIAVDAADRLYVLGSTGTLTRFTAAGAQDTTFGQGGMIELKDPYDGNSLCYAGYLTLVASRVLVSDTCNTRLLVFDDTGAFVETINPPLNGYAITQATYFDGTHLWVPLRNFIVKYRYSGGTFVEDGTVTLDPSVELSGNIGLTRSSNGLLWLVSGINQLIVLNENGGLESRFQLGDHTYGLLGEAPLPRNVVQLKDGTIGILAATSERLERYEPTLK